jgi:aspartokinase-like uncharacterized kinase
MPSRMALAADIPASWDITSDSLAAWLAGRLGARQLLLVKHLSLGAATVALPAATVSSPDLIAHGVVDAAFAEFLQAANVPAALLGPADHTLLSEIIRRGATAGTRIDA